MSLILRVGIYVTDASPFCRFEETTQITPVFFVDTANGTCKFTFCSGASGLSKECHMRMVAAYTKVMTDALYNNGVTKS